MLKKRFILIAALVLLVVAASAHAETGCCLNAKSSACKSTELTRDECCPVDNPFYYGPDGAPDYDTCRSPAYFIPNTNCMNVSQCARGCCCNPSASWATAPECKQGKFTPYNEVVDCNKEFCDKFNLPGTELPTSLSCGAGSPNPYATATHVKGEKYVGLSFGSSCAYAPSYYKVERRSSEGRFRQLVNNYKGVTYVDRDPLLNWSNTYTYKITAIYLLKNNVRANGTKTMTFILGDILCWQKYDSNPFCVGPDFFSIVSPDKPPFIPYFSQNLKWAEADIPGKITTNYGGYFYNGYNCSAGNTPDLVKDCGADEACVYTGPNLNCFAKGECAGVNPFGLFTATPAQCEKTPAPNLKDKYCFFDSSVTLVGKCYDCNSEMACYDYKSEAACIQDHCWANGPTRCQWSWVNEELGVGVCRAPGKDNCKYCTTSGTKGVNSSEAHNYVFNRCTPEKLRALEVPGYPCGAIENVSCRDLVCEVVNINEGLCANSISLNDNNSVKTGSSICNGGIKVCMKGSGKCFKDANGDGTADCAEGNVSCQRDRFPPKTKLSSYAVLTPKDNLMFTIYDRKDNDGTEKTYALSQGYLLYICAYGDNEMPCGPFGYSQLGSYHRMSSTTANVGDLLSAGVLNFSVNNIRFFAVDPAKNVEVIKTEKVRVTTNAVGGLGVFLVSPKNNSYLNYTPVTFRIRADCYKGGIFELILKDSTGDTKAEFYRGSAVSSVDQSRSVGIGGTNGRKDYTLVTRYDEPPKNRENHITIFFDDAHPDAPRLNAVPSAVSRNYINVSGSAEKGINVSLETEFNKGGWQFWKKVEVPTNGHPSKPNGNFSTLLFLTEGAWRVRARAIDKAENPSVKYSNNLSFRFDRSAPSFDISPPYGAVRPYVRNVTVYYHLQSGASLDRAKSNITLLKAGDKVHGRLTWKNPSTLVYVPSSGLSNGTYSIMAKSVDNRSRTLEKISVFTISSVPEILANWTRSVFKTNNRIIPLSGSMSGRGFFIKDAYIDVDGNRQDIRSAGEFPIKTFNFVKAVDLGSGAKDGPHQVVIVATNNLSRTAREPFEVVLDTTPPKPPKMGFR